MRHAFALLLLLSLACGDDDRRPGDSGRHDTGAGDASMADASGIDSGGVDAGRVDSGGLDSGGLDSGGVDAGRSMAQVDLTFSGCAPDFSGDVVVVTNAESIAVSATSGGALTGSIQLDLDDVSGTVALSTQHRVDTGAVINVIVGTTWTNIAMDSRVLAGEIPDPIGGTVRIDSYSRADGVMDLTFTGATLQNPSDGTSCRLDGRLQTFGRSF